VTSFPFDAALRATIGLHLHSFDRRLRADSGDLKRAAVAIGRVDPGETIEQTALRELEEELGITLSAADILGALDDYPTRSGYLMAPVVIWAPAGIDVKPNPSEVAAAYRIACSELFREGSPEIVAIEESDRPIIRLPLSVSTVNAPTAAVLYQFREVALAGRDTRVDHYEQPVFAWR